jgi:hypothetical protein
MNFYAQTSNSVPNILLCLPLIIIMLFLFHCHANSPPNTTSIGVIIDVNSETGKQQRTAMQIAAQSFNNYSNNQNISFSSVTLVETLYKQLQMVSNFLFCFKHLIPNNIFVEYGS